MAKQDSHKVDQALLQNLNASLQSKAQEEHEQVVLKEEEQAEEGMEFPESPGQAEVDEVAP